MRNCFRKPCELAFQIMNEVTERGKTGPSDGCSGFRWSSLCDRMVRLTIHMVSHGFGFHFFVELYYMDRNHFALNSCSNSGRFYFSRQTKVVICAQDPNRGSQKHRLRQEIPRLCKQLAHCFVQRYSQIRFIALLVVLASKEFWVLAVVSINLADLLGNRCSF